MPNPFQPQAALARPTGFSPQTGSRGVVTRGQALPPDSRAELARLSAIFPQCETIGAGFTGITVPAGLTAPTANESYWFPLINFNPREELGQDIIVFGIWVDMVSADVTPADTATNCAWGTEYGTGAAVIVGENLPFASDNTWTMALSPIAGIETAGPILIQSSRARKYWSRSFPPGKFATGFQKRGVSGSFIPFVRRIGQGRTLDAGLIVRGSQLAGLAGSRVLQGFLDLEIYYGLTRNTVNQDD